MHVSEPHVVDSAKQLGDLLILSRGLRLRAPRAFFKLTFQQVVGHPKVLDVFLEVSVVRVQLGGPLVPVLKILLSFRYVRVDLLGLA